jgi:hypothetical protein
MKAEWRIFAIVATFLYGACVLYAWWSNHTMGSVEWIGSVALLLSGLLCTMCASYFWFVSSRIDLRPEDRQDAEVSDGAGEVGFFSPGSYWPFGVALGAITAATGIALWQPWLIIVGLAGTMIGATALIFEYYTATRRAAH